jgi:Ca2+-binding EF-hand superfamily protein
MLIASPVESDTKPTPSIAATDNKADSSTEQYSTDTDVPSSLSDAQIRALFDCIDRNKNGYIDKQAVIDLLFRPSLKQEDSPHQALWQQVRRLAHGRSSSYPPHHHSSTTPIAATSSTDISHADTPGTSEQALNVAAVLNGSNHLSLRLAYADELIRVCDTTVDGKITLEELKRFLRHKEKELWTVFNQMDVSGNGELTTESFQKALSKSGKEFTIISYK